MHKKLGKITSAEVALDRGCFLTFWLTFDFGGSGQGFGGYVLGNGNEKRTDPPAAADALGCIMRLFEVESFRKIEGRVAYALYDNDSFGELIRGVEVPEFDNPKTGPNRFVVHEWQRRWWPEKYPLEEKTDA